MTNKEIIADAKNYQGWTNYETWAVNLWIENDENISNQFHDRAIHWDKEKSTSEYWTQKESAKFNLSDEIKDFVEEESPLADEASMYTDLLNSAIEEVNYHEIAEAKLEAI